MAHEPNEVTTSGAKIQEHFNSESGELILLCENATFIRIRDLVMAEAGLTTSPDHIRVVVVDRTPTPAKTNRVGDRLALLGCSLIGFVLFFVVIAGVRAIANWFR